MPTESERPDTQSDNSGQRSTLPQTSGSGGRAEAVHQDVQQATFPVEQIRAAVELQAGRHVHGKVVIDL